MSPLSHHIQRHCVKAKHHFWNVFVPHEGNDHRPHALRHKALTAYAVAIILVKVVVSGAAFVYPGPSSTSDLTQGQVIKLTNAARTNNKLKTLATNASLNAGAQLKANDMLSKQYFAHVSPTKVTPWYWFKKAGYNYSAAGENLAIDFTTSEDVVEAWLASASHRKNLLSAQYKDIGVAVATGNMNGMSSTVVVQFFGAAVVPKQQPQNTMPKKVTPKKPTTSTKPSTVAVATPVKTPVLGEEIETPMPIEPVAPVPPAVPKLTSPDAGTILGTAKPWIGGEAQVATTVNVFSDGKRIGQVVSDDKGYFSLQPGEDLADGAHLLTAVAVSGDLQSATSASLSVSVDTLPPSASLGTTIVLPSYLNPGTLTVSGVITGDDVASARVFVGNATAAIPQAKGPFLTQLTPGAGSSTDMINVELKDSVGNVSLVPLASLSFLDVEVLTSSPEGLAEWIPRIVFFSRKFFLTFWLFLFLALAVNVIVKIRVQHRPVILYSLLLLYGLTIIMVTT